MSEPEKRIRRFVIDTNVFVSAIKPFSKHSGGSYKDAKTLSLLIKLIVNEDFELVGNSRLVDEYKRLSEELDSETSRLILRNLTRKVKIVEVDEAALMNCKPYLPVKESADVMHAATSLQTNAIRITNDKDFDMIRRSEIIRVWSISEAIRNLLTDA
ncbi:MAG: PIN domain-containing protein [Thaumarchaeota archaeon]|nr:PIN domain-containing protein [Nitrososphaerota archaeon]